MSNYSLNEKVRCMVAPLVVEILKAAGGRRLTSLDISRKIRETGHSADRIEVRAAINHIRTNGMLDCVCSSSDGYYVATTDADITETIYSLEGRVEAIQEVIEALKCQRHYKFNV